MSNFFTRTTGFFMSTVMAASAIITVEPIAFAAGTAKDEAEVIELNEEYMYKQDGGYAEGWYEFETEETELGIDSWFKFTFSNINNAVKGGRHYLKIYNNKGLELETFDGYTNTEEEAYFMLEQEEIYYFTLSANTAGEMYLEVEEIIDEGGEDIDTAVELKTNQTYKNTLVPYQDVDWFYVETAKETPTITVSNSGSIFGSGSVSVYAEIYDENKVKIKSFSTSKNKSNSVPITVEEKAFYVKIFGNNVNYTLTVEDDVKATKIKLNKSKLTLKKGKTSTLKVTATPKEADTNLTWKSSNTKVATVDKNGKIKAKKKGKVTITVTDKNSGKKATCTVTVK